VGTRADLDDVENTAFLTLSGNRYRVPRLSGFVLVVQRELRKERKKQKGLKEAIVFLNLTTHGNRHEVASWSFVSCLNRTVVGGT